MEVSINRSSLFCFLPRVCEDVFMKWHFEKLYLYVGHGIYALQSIQLFVLFKPFFVCNLSSILR